ncbi:MAG: FAD-dependent oxidoreductase, partial [Planctomycetota bacterium]
MKSASSAAAAAAAITHSADQQVVLVGLGHTNVQVLIQWARMRPTAARLMCISDQPQASYSGMLPGVLAGQYEPAELQIDLPSLCRQAGAELVIANWCALDRERRELHFTDHAPIRYDLLSIGIGSRPSLDSIVIAEEAPLISIKPMQTLVERLRAAAAQRCSQGSIGSKRDDGQGNEHRPVDDQLETGGQVIVVGGGAGGFEVASTLPRFFERHGLARPQITLLTRSAEILPTLAPSTQRRARRHLEQQGVTILTRHEARRVQSDQVVACALPSPTSAPSACQSHVRTQVPSPQPLPVTQVPSPQPLPNILN